MPSNVFCVSGVASCVSSFTVGSVESAFWKAAFAPAWSFLPLPRTIPTYIHALAITAGLHFSPQAVMVPVSTPSALSKSVAR